MSTDYPITLVKGDETRQAKNRRDVTKYRFEGFMPASEATSPVADVDDDTPEPSYAELQDQARDLKEKGHEIQLNLSYDNLLEAVTEAQQAQNEYDELTRFEAEGGN